MSKVIKSAGYGLLAAGILLVLIYFLGAYLKGYNALSDALNPLTMGNYLTFAPLAPGVFLLWLGDYMATRRRRYGLRGSKPKGSIEMTRAKNAPSRV